MRSVSHKDAVHAGRVRDTLPARPSSASARIQRSRDLLRKDSENKVLVLDMNVRPSSAFSHTHTAGLQHHDSMNLRDTLPARPSSALSQTRGSRYNRQNNQAENSGRTGTASPVSPASTNTQTLSYPRHGKAQNRPASASSAGKQQQDAGERMYSKQPWWESPYAQNAHILRHRQHAKASAAQKNSHGSKFIQVLLSEPADVGIDSKNHHGSFGTGNTHTTHTKAKATAPRPTSAPPRSSQAVSLQPEISPMVLDRQAYLAYMQAHQNTYGVSYDHLQPMSYEYTGGDVSYHTRPATAGMQPQTVRLVC